MINFLMAGILLLLSHQTVLAGSDDTVTFQGIVSSTDGIPGHLIINERNVMLDNRVEVLDHKEREKSLSDIKTGKWIYAVSRETLSGHKVIRIYLLPGKIKHGEKHNYPFMQKEEDDD